MKLTVIAWRNVWRRKRRTLITGFSIGFGVMLAVTFTGTGDYMYTNMINSSATMGLGHITVAARGYNDTPTLDKRLDGVAELRQTLQSNPSTTQVVIRIMGQAMFASAIKTVGGVFIAVDPAQESENVNEMLKSIIEGKIFTSSSGRGVVVGQRMAERLKLKLGKKLVYTTTDIHGEIVSAIARVSGIYKTGINEVDGHIVLLPLNRVRKILQYGDDEAGLVAVMIRDQRYTDSVQQQLLASVGRPEREVLSWRQTQSDLAGLITIDRSSNYITQLLVGLLIAAGILNTLLMSVLERTREFGIMIAVGMSPATLFRLVMAESFWMALIGLLLGILLTAPWFYYMSTVGIDFSSSIGNEYTASGVLIDPVIKIRLFKESVAVILLAVFTLTMVSGLYPAWRAGRVVPVESIKTI
ncbi:MAG: ABC transporter permease [Gammaproteobacteria bacterium]|nr:MAG: ABC transporter permease [Gammaproteobacteria bacterium]